MEETLALQAAEGDNVATIFHSHVTANTLVTVVDPKGNRRSLTACSAIPYGHKIALCDLKAGAHITKYGSVIGGASRGISAGEYVHVHNMDSLRGRGDLEGGGT